MNQAIYKYEIPVRDNFELMLPVGAKILCVQVDQKNGKPHIWAIVYPSATKTMHYFELFGTGWGISDSMGTERKYIGTFQLDNGDFIQHLFERL
jgi:hypothetical protein